VLTAAQVRTPIDECTAQFYKGAVSNGSDMDFWTLESDVTGLEFIKGDLVRLKTCGRSPFIETISKLETDEAKSVTNFSGGQAVGSSWTDKLMTVGGAKEKDREVLAQDKMEGVADDEWD
jgi:hypothetical protein